MMEKVIGTIKLEPWQSKMLLLGRILTLTAVLMFAAHFFMIYKYLGFEVHLRLVAIISFTVFSLGDILCRITLFPSPRLLETVFKSGTRHDVPIMLWILSLASPLYIGFLGRAIYLGFMDDNNYILWILALAPLALISSVYERRIGARLNDFWPVTCLTKEVPLQDNLVKGVNNVP
ncbi:hypothetical protein IIA79_04815 [bacterium]|nr:hypothetical protein [bacterium]